MYIQEWIIGDSENNAWKIMLPTSRAVIDIIVYRELLLHFCHFVYTSFQTFTVLCPTDGHTNQRTDRQKQLLTTIRT